MNGPPVNGHAVVPLGQTLRVLFRVRPGRDERPYIGPLDPSECIGRDTTLMLVVSVIQTEPE